MLIPLVIAILPVISVCIRHKKIVIRRGVDGKRLTVAKSYIPGLGDIVGDQFFGVCIELHELVGQICQICGLGLILGTVIRKANVPGLKVGAIFFQLWFLSEESLPLRPRQRLQLHISEGCGLGVFCGQILDIREEGLEELIIDVQAVFGIGIGI